MVVAVGAGPACLLRPAFLRRRARRPVPKEEHEGGAHSADWSSVMGSDSCTAVVALWPALSVQRLAILMGGRKKQ